MSKKLIKILVLVFLFLFISIFYLIQIKNNKKDKLEFEKKEISLKQENKFNVEENEKNKEDKTPKKDDVYFGLGSFDKGYYLVNTRTGEKEKFIPDGYEIVGDYSTFSEVLILKKDNKIYSFDVKNNNVKEISEIKLFSKNKDEDGVNFSVIQSKSNKNNFLIFVYSYKDLGLEMDSFFTKRKEIYFYDYENKLTQKKKELNFLLESTIYDLDNNKFFSWEFNPGGPFTSPIFVYNKNGIKIDTIFSNEKENLYKVEKNNNYIFATFSDSKNYIKYFDIFDFKNIKKLTLSDEILKEINIKFERDFDSIYSLAINEKFKTLIGGYDDKIILYRFNDDGLIIDQKTFSEKEIYANFIFVDENKLYYLNDESFIKVVDLDKWKVVNEINVKDLGEEITLFKK